jgi:nitrogen regulatory protein P-II 1
MQEKWHVKIIPKKTNMKEVKAIVKPFKVNDIINRLLDSGYPNITVALAEGTGNFKNSDSSLSMHFSITDSKVAVIGIICKDDEVDTIVEIISLIGRTGNPGDGIITVSDIKMAIRVKNKKNLDL